MSNSKSKHMPDLQKMINEKMKPFLPPPPLPQLGVPAWKEGSPEWCEAIARRSAENRS